MIKKVAVVVGTRPEAIKMAPVILSLRKFKEFKTLIVSTGQHRELLADSLGEFGLNADFDLDLMKSDQTLSSLTASILNGLEKLFSKLSPDLVLVHGDTTTSFSTALSCFYQKIPCHHIEAGLRSHNLSSPFPEEFNRKAIAQICQRHFSVDSTGAINLMQEGVPSSNIEISGNTVFESLKLFVKDSKRKNETPHLVVTLHRRENGDEVLEKIFLALRKFVILAEQKGNSINQAKTEPFEAAVDGPLKVSMPLHPNPRIGKLAHKILGGVSGIHLMSPLKYSSFLSLLQSCDVVLTDSGGVQEEASNLNKFVLLAREVTERNIGFESGKTKLVGTDGETIFKELRHTFQNFRKIDSFPSVSELATDLQKSELTLPSSQIISSSIRKELVSA